MRSMLTMNLRAFSAGYNYSASTNPRVFLNVAKDGSDAGRMVFELYENHAPNLATNFAALCTGAGHGSASFAGSGLTNVVPGLGVQGGMGDVGATNERLSDENLHLRHHKRGILTMTNSGSHSNGSGFQVLFGEAHYLDGYQQVVGELVEGDSVLNDIEGSAGRYSSSTTTWTVSSSGML